MAHTNKKKGFEQWEIEGAANTLVEAKVMKKSQPDLFKLAMKELKKRKKAINELV